MNYRILRVNRAFELIWSDGADPNNNRYIGWFRTRYEADFEKAQLEKGANLDELKKRLADRDRYTRRPKRTRYQKIIQSEERRLFDGQDSCNHIHWR
jgi:molybdopterin converting factor small subunit